MQRASVTNDSGQESTLMYAIGKKVKVIGGIYVVAGLFLLLGPGRPLLLNLNQVWQGNIFAIMGLYIPLVGIALITLGTSQLLFTFSTAGKRQTQPDWLPLVHSFPYWLMITAACLPFFGILCLMGYKMPNHVKEVLENGFPESSMWIGVVFAGLILSFFAYIFSQMWYVSSRDFFSNLMRLTRTKQVGKFDKEKYYFGDIIRFSMDNIRGEQFRVFLNCVAEGRKEEHRGPRATPFVSFRDVNAGQLKRGIQLEIPKDSSLFNKENYYWEVLVETFESNNWARFGVKISTKFG